MTDSSPSRAEPELERIVEELRREMGGAGLDPRDEFPSTTPPGHATAGPASALPRMAESMLITSDRPLVVKPGPLGPFRRFAKRVIRKATRWQVEALAADVRTFAQATTDAVVGELAPRFDHLARRVDDTERTSEELRSLIAEVRREVAAEHDRLGRIERSASVRSTTRGSPAAPVTAQAPTPPRSPAGNAFDYFAFEARFRGSRDEISSRQRDYVELLSTVDDIVDVGCGRGELLAMLRDAGKRVRGVDADADMVELAKSEGLDVKCGDGVAFLEALDGRSIGAVCALQVVEHLEPGRLMEFLRAAHRALRVNGVLLLETINPASISALRNYFSDLTHANPLIPETLAFLAESVGFKGVRIELRSPVPETQRLQSIPFEPPVSGQAQSVADRNVGILNALLFAPQDYALVARA